MSLIRLSSQVDRWIACALHGLIAAVSTWHSRPETFYDRRGIHRTKFRNTVAFHALCSKDGMARNELPHLVAKLISAFCLLQPLCTVVPYGQFQIRTIQMAANQTEQTHWKKKKKERN